MRSIVKKALRTRDLASADATRDLPRRRRADGGPGALRHHRREPADPRRLRDPRARRRHRRRTVLITGESGTGKELVARALHENSSRARQARSSRSTAPRSRRSLMESELFGYERGAFTGAVGTKPGRFELAVGRHAVPRRDRRDPQRDAGEAPARPPGERVRARRRHQDHPRRRAPGGGDEPRPQAGDRRRARSARTSTTASTWCRSRCRRCATRRTDIAAPASRTSSRSSTRGSRRASRASSRRRSSGCSAYAWPGNIRELENVIERAVLFADGARIRLEDLRGRAAAARRRSRRDARSPARRAVAGAPTRRRRRRRGRRATRRPQGAGEGRDEPARARPHPCARSSRRRTTSRTRRAFLKISRKGLQLKMKELNLRERDPE